MQETVSFFHLWSPLYFLSEKSVIPSEVKISPVNGGFHSSQSVCGCWLTIRSSMHGSRIRRLHPPYPASGKQRIYKWLLSPMIPRVIGYSAGEAEEVLAATGWRVSVRVTSPPRGAPAGPLRVIGQRIVSDGRAELTVAVHPRKLEGGAPAAL